MSEIGADDNKTPSPSDQTSIHPQPVSSEGIKHKKGLKRKFRKDEHVYVHHDLATVLNSIEQTNLPLVTQALAKHEWVLSSNLVPVIHTTMRSCFVEPNSEDVGLSLGRGGARHAME